MNILIAGVDGYLGWPLSQHLASLGHRVIGIDCGLRRELVESDMGSVSAIPIAPMQDRWVAFRRLFGDRHEFHIGTLMHHGFLAEVLAKYKPEAIVHLAEQPSAPYSMRDVKSSALTQANNVIGTLNLLWAMRASCPSAHLVKLGTMGEYGTPNIDIPEGFFEIEYRGRRDRLPFPRQAGSWYHQSKVHDSNNIMLACRVWGLRSTDIMQGVVYGTRNEAPPDDAALWTRFDFDQCFGTAINRFCAQAVAGLDLTPFGSGRQRRGFLPLKDSMRCITLVLEHLPAPGEYRVINQFEEPYEISDLAERVRSAAKGFGIEVGITPIRNPRVESESHYYNPDRVQLVEWGYRPTRDTHSEISNMIEDLMPHRRRIEEHRHVLSPSIFWGERA